MNNTLASDNSYAASCLSMEDVRKAIDHARSQGGSNGRHWILDIMSMEPEGEKVMKLIIEKSSLFCSNLQNSPLIGL